MIDVDLLVKKYLKVSDQNDGAVYKATTLLLKKLLHQDEINNFIIKNRHLEGFEFNDAVLDYFDFSFQISNRDRERIPDQGRVIIVANHPIGSLDGLALLKLISEIRSDVKVVANTLLNQIDPLKNLFIAVDNLSNKALHRQSLRSIQEALEQEKAVILFPTGEVSRIRPNGVRDGKWKSGFVHLAKKTDSPVLPVYINAKNSALFYSLSSFYKPLGTFMLVNEMFNKHDKEIFFRVGNMVPWSSMEKLGITKKAIAKRMRKQVYRLSKKKRKPELFDSVKSIVHPAKSRLIRKELQASELIGSTHDGQQIYLFDYFSNSSVMREIGRLREISFRMVQEGTGTEIDLDEYDRYYRHLVLWDDSELEIVGSYRIGEAKNIINKYGADGLYSNSLFEYDAKFVPYINQAIELGRSFIQPRYWGKRSLDYLWFGIGAYLNKNPDIRFMFGPVSLSASYPEMARQKICAFYSQLFGSDMQLAKARNSYPFPHIKAFESFSPEKDESDYKQGFLLLKSELDELGVRVPALYKQYVELCHPGGCLFLDFNKDENFSDCIDGLILVDIEKVKKKKRDRYINSHKSIKDQSVA